MNFGMAELKIFIILDNMSRQFSRKIFLKFPIRVDLIKKIMISFTLASVLNI